MSGDRIRPIGVFDSGVGGLTVLRELRRRLPAESLLYFGDTARVPYGPKSPATVLRYATEACSFLLSRDVKMIVLACNTATAHAAETLARELPVPVLGVIQPGARAAVARTRTARIAVLGTAGTIASGAYDLAVRRLLPDSRVYAQQCPLLVPLVEEGLVGHPATRLILQDYLRPLQEVEPDVLILGCTHYPLVRPLVSELLGQGVTIVDSAEEAASDAERLLREHGLAHEGPGDAALSFVVSDSPLRFREVGRRLVGTLIRKNVEHVDVDGYEPVA